MVDNSDDCPITITNNDFQINELLCFVACKSRIMPNPQISKLCCDFYSNSAIQEAKDMLLSSTSLPEFDKRKTRRKTRIAETNMQDIITIFYEMKPREMPVFVAKNVNNLPPLSMNNFDMAHIIEEMSNIKCKMSILQEAQEKSLAVHAALCNDVPERAHFDEAPPTSSDGAMPEVFQLQQEVIDDTPKSPVVVFNITGNSTEHGMDGNDEDLVNLARIQDGIPPVVHHRPPSTPTRSHLSDVPPLSPNDSIMSNTSYASLVRNGQLNTQSGHDRRNIRPTHNQRNRRKQNTVTRNGNNRRDDDVITGSGNNFDICASDHQRRRFDPKYKECIGVFVSRLQRNTRAVDVERHVSRVCGLRLKCEPVPTKFETYNSYRIRASARDRDTLLNSNKWPRNVIVKEYYKVIY